MSAIPTTMRAAVTQASKIVAVQNVPVPTLAANEILIKTSAVALNPADWKHVVYANSPGTISGSDFTGTVVKVGENLIANVSVGDTVAGCVHGGVRTDRGAFSEYVKTFADLVWKIPEGIMSAEEASTTGAGFFTAIQALYDKDRLGLIEPYETKPAENTWVFIYGGSSSVGQYAIQLAHISGYKVATVASPRNYELVTSLGADFVVDYKDPEAVTKIKAASNDSVNAALDTIGEQGAQEFSVNVFSASKSGKVVTLAPIPEGVTFPRKDVTVQTTAVYTAFGLEDMTFGVNLIPSDSDRKQIASFFEKKASRLFSEGLKPNVVKIWDGGLEKIQDGLQYMMDGKVSGEKIVYRI